MKKIKSNKNRYIFYHHIILKKILNEKKRERFLHRIKNKPFKENISLILLIYFFLKSILSNEERTLSVFLFTHLPRIKNKNSLFTVIHTFTHILSHTFTLTQKKIKN